MAGKKTHRLDIPLDDELYDQIEEYAQENKVKKTSLARALLRWFTDPRDPRPLPPGIEEEDKRPSRRKPDSET